MASSVASLAILLAVIFMGYGRAQDLKYETHEPYVQPAVTTHTTSTTVTVTHTVRQVVTSGVYDEDFTTLSPVVTTLHTQYSFTGINEGTDTSVVTATATPVVVVTRTRVTTPVRTLVSVFSKFSTVTVTADFVFTVKSEQTQLSVLITPVYKTSVLQQVVATTTTLSPTITTTLTTPKYGYRN